MSSILPRFRSRERAPGTMASQGQEEALDSTSAQAANGDTPSTPASPRIGFSISRYVHHVVKATLHTTKANFLLVFIPLSIVGAAHEWNPALIFGLSFFAMFPLAEVLSWSTEELSASTGQVIGGLLMAAFGNAVEMIVSCTCTTLLSLAYWLCELLRLVS